MVTEEPPESEPEPESQPLVMDGAAAVPGDPDPNVKPKTLPGLPHDMDGQFGPETNPALAIQQQFATKVSEPMQKSPLVASTSPPSIKFTGLRKGVPKEEPSLNIVGNRQTTDKPMPMQSFLHSEEGDKLTKAVKANKPLMSPPTKVIDAQAGNPKLRPKALRRPALAPTEGLTVVASHTQLGMDDQIHRNATSANVVFEENEEFGEEENSKQILQKKEHTLRVLLETTKVLRVPENLRKASKAA